MRTVPCILGNDERRNRQILTLAAIFGGSLVFGVVMLNIPTATRAIASATTQWGKAETIHLGPNQHSGMQYFWQRRSSMDTLCIAAGCTVLIANICCTFLHAISNLLCWCHISSSHRYQTQQHGKEKPQQTAWGQKVTKLRSPASSYCKEVCGITSPKRVRFNDSQQKSPAHLRLFKVHSKEWSC